MRIFRVAGLALALLSGGCVISTAPLLGPEARTAPPFPARISLQAYERESSTAPWKPNGDVVELVTDANRVVREAEAGKPADDEYTFHQIAPDRYLTQARFSANRYAYGLLEIRDGQGYMTAFQCKAIDPSILQRAGVKVAADDCSLDGAPNPLAFLKELAAVPGDPRIRYTPVAKK
jgi:hypothetical protein